MKRGDWEVKTGIDRSDNKEDTIIFFYNNKTGFRDYWFISKTEMAMGNRINLIRNIIEKIKEGFKANPKYQSNREGI